MSGFDAVTLVPPNAYLLTDVLLPPKPEVCCHDCDKPMEPFEQWQVALHSGRVVRGLCRTCAIRRDPELAS